MRFIMFIIKYSNPECLNQIFHKNFQLNMEDMDEEDDVLIGEGPSLDRPMTSLEKLHIIVGYALRRPHIR